jgi:hypothetical protein
MYPAVPGLYQSVSNIQPQPVASTSTASTNAAASPSSVITNAQSFVVPLGAQAAYPQYPSAPGQYATTPYYHQYAYTAGAPGGTYYPQPQQAQSAPPATQPQSAQPRAATATAATTQPTATITTTPATGGTVVGNQGAWSDEETERLKKMAEDHRVKATGEINWDAVIQEWGISRTRFAPLFCSIHFRCINWYWIGTKFLSRLLRLDSRRVQHVASNAVEKMCQVMRLLSLQYHRHPLHQM